MENTQYQSTGNISSVGGERPWYGTLLGTLYYLSAVLAICIGLVIITNMMGVTSISIFGIGGGGYVTALIIGETSMLIGVVLGAILAFLFGRGYMNGQKWAVTVSLVIFVLSFLGSLMSFDIIRLILSALLAWSAFSCLRHPFYNRG